MKNLSNKRLRISLTPACNLWCLFCSNEGSTYDDRKSQPANLDLVFSLGNLLLKNTDLDSIDFSGGEPTLHPDFTQRRYDLINWTKTHPQAKFTLHSNGIRLFPEVIDAVKESFVKLGVSVNSLNFDIWNRITNSQGLYSVKEQRRKFRSLLTNLNYLSRQGIGEKVFMKSVVVRRSEEHTSELQSHSFISYAVFCLKKKNQYN